MNNPYPFFPGQASRYRSTCDIHPPGQLFKATCNIGFEDIHTGNELLLRENDVFMLLSLTQRTYGLSTPSWYDTVILTPTGEIGETEWCKGPFQEAGEDYAVPVP